MTGSRGAFIRVGQLHTLDPERAAGARTGSEATEYVEGWLSEPNVRWTVPGPRHHDLAFGFLRSVGTAANLTTDVQLAAIAVENDATICSNDADFARFSGIHWVNLLAPK